MPPRAARSWEGRLRSAVRSSQGRSERDRAGAGHAVAAVFDTQEPALRGIASTSPGKPPRCTPGATGMTTRLFLLLALVVGISGACAALVTLFTPPLTLPQRN